MTDGNPRCEFCDGRGGAFSNGRWRKCSCTSGTKEQRDLVSRFFHPLGVPKDKESMRQRIDRMDRERGK